VAAGLPLIFSTIVGAKKAKANHATDVALANALTFADFNHQRCATRREKEFS